MQLNFECEVNTGFLELCRLVFAGTSTSAELFLLEKEEPNSVTQQLKY